MFSLVLVENVPEDSAGRSQCSAGAGDQAGTESLGTVSTMLGFFPGTLQIKIYIYIPVNKTIAQVH